MVNSWFEPLSTACYGRFSRVPRYYVRTYGCQQNVSDSEHIKGMFEFCGFTETESENDADIIVFNTCAVREHAEDRVFGNIGQLKKLKEDRPEIIIAVGGCMVQQKHIAEKLKMSYPQVSVVFDTNNLSALPELITDYINAKKRVFAKENIDDVDAKLPTKLDGTLRAWLPIMYGCNNFCTYCIVPYVRHRERSRSAESVVAEFRLLLKSGKKDITLLGQNVNSYGKAQNGEVDFPKLLRLLCREAGDYTVRFMTSHPKDATHELFDVIAENPQISRHFHLPVQSGSNGILERMNRKYTAEHYTELIDYARSRIPAITFTSDIIVGFPDETDEDFEATMRLVERVRYKDLFTFIYSKRVGTPAAEMHDGIPHSVKVERLERLTAVQSDITAEYERALLGKKFRGLPELSENGGVNVRLDNNSVVSTPDRLSKLTGFCTVQIDEYNKNRLSGRIITDGD